MLNKKKNYTFDWNEFKGSLQTHSSSFAKEPFFANAPGNNDNFVH